MLKIVKFKFLRQRIQKFCLKLMKLNVRTKKYKSLICLKDYITNLYYLSLNQQ